MCGTRTLTDEEQADAAEMVGEYRLRVHSKMAKKVPVHWHSVRVGGRGDTDKQIDDSIKVLNDSFGGKFEFTLASKRVSSSSQDWNIDYTSDTNLKSARKGECNALNVYSTLLKGGLLGYANYPNSCSSRNKSDGVVIGYGTVPGGGSAPYNLGDTLTHEVGHWLNLAHTFSGGCSSNGDGVEDTPAVKEPNFGCPQGKDSCSGGGKDLIENFMDYTDDSCMDSFTNGQFERALAAWERYRAQDDEPVPQPVPAPVSEPVAQPVEQPSSASCDGLTKKECNREENCVFGKKKKVFEGCVLKGKFDKADCESRSGKDCVRQDATNSVGVCKLVGTVCVTKCDGEESEKRCKQTRGDFRSKKICKAIKETNPCFKCQPKSTCGQ